jgi:hypothetical protein
MIDRWPSTTKHASAGGDDGGAVGGEGGDTGEHAAAHTGSGHDHCVATGRKE